MTKMTEEILSLICEKGEISVRDIKNVLNIASEKLELEMCFLIEFGFVKLDKTKQYVRLSNRSKKYVRDYYVEV